MPIARLQLPDGRIGRFEVPEGATEQQILDFVQQQTPQISAPAQPTLEAAPIAPTEPLPWASPEAAAQRRVELGESVAQYGELAARGLAELPLGVAQTIAEQVPGQTAEQIRESIARVTAETERQAAEAGLAGQVARIAPQVAQLAPVALPGVLGGAITGAGISAVQPIAEPAREAAIDERLQRAETGALLGAGLGVVTRLAPTISKGLDTLRDNNLVDFVVEIGGSIANDFTFDDDPCLVENQAIRTLNIKSLLQDFRSRIVNIWSGRYCQFIARV